MHYYYTCLDLGIGRTALRRQPCNCADCNDTVRKPWGIDKNPEKQQRFVNPDDYFWKDVYGKHNDWYIVNVKPTGDDE